ncbi:MAG: DinB family protein [Anaerolineaceae bacterium]
MIDFTPLHQKKTSIVRMADAMTPDDLRDAAESVYTYILDQLSVCDDHDVVFQPEDPSAIDPYTLNAEELHIAWTLAHVIVHLNASNEESAFLAAELARGVEFHGRSRYEVPWQEVTTIRQLRRLTLQSQKFMLSSLDLWPDPPHYEATYSPWASAGIVDARGRYLLGLKHTDDHLAQIREIIRQSKAAVEPSRV